MDKLTSVAAIADVGLSCHGFFLRSLSKVTSLAQNVNNCRQEFDKDRGMKQLPYNEEQIHKFEKSVLLISALQTL